VALHEEQAIKKPTPFLMNGLINSNQRCVLPASPEKKIDITEINL